MVWGCMTWHGVGYLTKIDNGLDAELYCQILDDEYTATLQYYNLTKDSTIFQHDNDPKHTANRTKQHLKNRKIQILDWPAQSPDMNPIEHLWHEVKKRIKQSPEKISGKDDLWDLITNVWNGIEPEICQTLYRSMTKRINDLYDANGGYTRW